MTRHEILVQYAKLILGLLALIMAFYFLNKISWQLDELRHSIETRPSASIGSIVQNEGG